MGARGTALEEQVKSTSRFCRGLGFNSQNSHDGLQPSVTLVPRDPTSFSGLHGHQAGSFRQMPIHIK